MNALSKLCSKCKQEKVFSEFYKCKGNLYDLDLQCKSCRKEYYDSTKEERRRVALAYRNNNIEDCRQRSSQWKRDNNERVIEYNKKYREDNSKYFTDYRKQYTESGKGRIKWHNRKAKEALLVRDFTVNEWVLCQEFFDNACAYCGEINNLTQDHVIPVIKGGGYTISNIVPACRWCNTSKATRDWVEWFSTKGFFTSERKELIQYYIDIFKHIHSKEVISNDMADN